MSQWPGILGVLIAVADLRVRSIAEFVIEYEWWKEMGQLATWQSIILYSFGPAWR